VSSRWLDAGAPLLAALVEALWAGALAALLTSSSPAGAVALCFCLIAAATLLAGRARRAAVAAAAQGAESPSHVAAAAVRYRLALLALGVGAAAALAALAAPHGLRATTGAITRAVVVVGACLELGALAGRAAIDPEGALRRALRGFLLLFAVLFVAALSGHGLADAGVLVALAVLGAAGLIVVVRMRSIVAAVEGGAAPVRWIGAVLLVDLLALTCALLLVAAPLHGALAGLGGHLAAGLHGLQDGLAYAASGTAYVVVRAIAALVAPFHLHLHAVALRPPPSGPLKTATPRLDHAHPLVAEVVGIGALVAVAALAAWLIARSLRVERRASGDAVVEEHERLAHEPELRSAGRRFARRLRGLVERDRTPAEALRAEYRRLERTLRRAGLARAPSWTVRRYLDTCLAGDDVRDTRARLIVLYERARYAGPAGGVGWADVEEFRRARRGLPLPPRS
jgi:hypothetical protein